MRRLRYFESLDNCRCCSTDYIELVVLCHTEDSTAGSVCHGTIERCVESIGLHNISGGTLLFDRSSHESFSNFHTKAGTLIAVFSSLEIRPLSRLDCFCEPPRIVFKWRKKKRRELEKRTEFWFNWFFNWSRNHPKLQLYAFSFF